MFIALLAPVLAPNDPNKSDLMVALQGASSQYPLGTDPLGRCILSRLLYGATVSIFSSLAITAFVFIIGTLIGVTAGYWGGKIDGVLNKFITVMQAFPKLILAIAIVGVLGVGIGNMIFALCIVQWAEYARLSRSLARSVKQRTFIKSAKICGESDWQIMRRHVIPNVIPPLIVNASLGISTMIMEVAALSYLGVGVKSPMAEWGAMLNSGKDYLQTNPNLVVIPGLAILVVSVLFNLFGDKLRDALDINESKI
ncbi:oligopeptide ABC transport system permease OppC2 [Acetobacterium woodii DSM 1030]|uniref:Oligopeptide ABC transport system permease OppC2 n=1 Tax=Acetobacterium woodii (strain ATCC 29683 / DSM 1030 / JCM 2381 / KCTC 1655 / WB1) TaxID=931626 RepID=H6LEC7_ACEWD|nr:oligopeptide ABC transport system permease OppC2 [Acetobacterium woodii DSM 1030]